MPFIGGVAFVCFIVSTLLWLTKTATGVLLTWQFFALFGLCWLTLHLVGWAGGSYNYRYRRSSAP